jgi:hypothetical protein
MLGSEDEDAYPCEGMESHVILVVRALEITFFTVLLFGLTYLVLQSLDKDLVFELRPKSRCK